ncbi:MAG: carbohydrate ABC transporter permease [Tissierellia bacterium]|nr:carbohydrate ABC transporter permease [Tissierellia bacterium]
MAKKKNSSINITKKTNVLFNILLLLVAIMSVFPILFVLVISVSTKESIAQYGFTLIPKGITLESYKVIVSGGFSIVSAFRNSIILTLVGTVTGLIVTTTYAYAMSRSDFAYKKFFSLVAFIPMLFGGGMVANYIVMTQVLGLKNTFFALLLPLLINTFYIIVMRTFYQTSVPQALIEAAKIDGASEFMTFFKIVLPVSLPGIATIGLFLTLAYWNDWFNAMLYLDQGSKYTPLQYMLMQMQKKIENILLKKDLMGNVAQEALKSLPADGVRMAVVVVSTLPIAMSYPFFQRYFVEGLTLGAVKE